MTKDPFTIDPAAPLGTANEVMQARGLRHLPVVVDDSRLIGAVTDRDLRHAALASFIGEFLSVSSQGRLRQLDDTLDGPEGPIATAACGSNRPCPTSTSPTRVMLDPDPTAADAARPSRVLTVHGRLRSSPSADG